MLNSMLDNSPGHDPGGDGMNELLRPRAAQKARVLLIEVMQCDKKYCALVAPNNTLGHVLVAKATKQRYYDTCTST